MKRIVTLTMSPTIDVNTSIDHVVAERKLRCASPSYEPGGGGINVSRAIRKLGGDSLAIYTNGGPTGQMLAVLLDREGLNHRPFPIGEWVRQNLIVFEEATTRQYRFGMPGPDLKENEWRGVLDTLASLEPKPDYIVASGSLPPGTPTDFYARVARIAREMGSRLILDTSGEPLPQAVREGVYLIKPNHRELGQLTGRGFSEESVQEEQAEEIIRSGKSEVVMVSLGAAGALLATREGIERLYAPSVPIRSKVGAGDSMVAGIVLSLAQGKSVSEAARFGVASGTAAVMTPGTELCRREDTERLYLQVVSRKI